MLLDGLHEDLNRVLKKPVIEMTPEREAELEKLPTQLASEQQWQIYRMRDDSLVVDFFQGQYRSRLECLTCHKVGPSVLPIRDTSKCFFVDVYNIQHLHVSDPAHSIKRQLKGHLATMSGRLR